MPANFPNPWRHRFNQPLLWVKYDNAVDGYVIEPNLEPVQNLAWDDLIAYEQACPMALLLMKDGTYFVAGTL